MPDTVKRLAQVRLTTADTLIYTVPALTTTRITSIYLSNTNTGSDRRVNINHVFGGGASADSNSLFRNYRIRDDETEVVGVGMVMETADELKGEIVSGTTLEVTATVYGIERT